MCVYHRLGGGGGGLILGLWKERGGVILILTVKSQCSSVLPVCRASVCMDFDFKHCYGVFPSMGTPNRIQILTCLSVNCGSTCPHHSH